MTRDRNLTGTGIALQAVQCWNVGRALPATIEDLVMQFGARWDPPVSHSEASRWLDSAPRSLVTVHNKE